MIILKFQHFLETWISNLYLQPNLYLPTGHDDDDDDDHDNDKNHDDDDDGQPDYCPKDNGLFPNPTDCTTFYTCVDGEATLQNCAPGLLFDKKLKMCNFANQVKCISKYVF